MSFESRKVTKPQPQHSRTPPHLTGSNAVPLGPRSSMYKINGRSHRDTDNKIHQPAREIVNPILDEVLTETVCHSPTFQSTALDLSVVPIDDPHSTDDFGDPQCSNENLNC